MFTPPPDITDGALTTALAADWGIEASALVYEPVGFGAHHWRATDQHGRRWFVTVHDLVAKRRNAEETSDEVFRRLTASFSAAAALAGAGLGFVLAPTPTMGGRAVARLDDRFSIAVHPHLDGHAAGDEGEFASDRERRAVLDLVVEVHRATGAARPHADVDARAVPHLEEIDAALDALGSTWDAGPYGERARTLLDEHATALRRLVTAYDGLHDQVAPLFERAVLTHGEPHASNVLVTADGLLLVDWDTALLAPAERDLTVLDPGDGSMLHAYASITGLTPSQPALDMYRLWFDLTEIGQYLGELRAHHTGTADIAESWKNLQHYLRPADRWPDLIG